MSCGLKEFLGEGAKGREPAYNPPPIPLPQSLKGVFYQSVEVEANGLAFHGTSAGWEKGVGGGQGATYEKVPDPPPIQSSPHSPACGLDFGSRYVKLVYAGGGGGLKRRKLDSLIFYQDYLRRRQGRLAIAWERLGLPPPAVLVATGYGKDLLRDHFPTITEIRAHFLGARHQTGLDHFVLLEMGGQDTKVLYVKEGRVFDFLANDKCAAGTGRYLENMARFLRMSLAKFAGAWEEPAEISQTCAIFGESELVGHLLNGVDPARIAAGVNASVARRAHAMVRRYRSPVLVFAGGVARNRAVVRLLAEHGDFRLLVPRYPQFTGALGCCLEAGRNLAQEHR